MWDQLEPTPPHLTYLLLSGFLITYVLFTNFLRNRLHLSEPPLALLFGIFLGPAGVGLLAPNFCLPRGCKSNVDISNPDDPGLQGWGWGDDVIQEATRIIVGVQVFAVGVELPRYYMSRHYPSILMMLGPVMSVGWVICAAFCYVIFGTDLPTSLVISACLTPTDPVLAASILSNSQFSERVPKRLKHMLSTESGCNDGVSFPFLYLGLYFLTQSTGDIALKDWFLITILWQCVFGTFIGLVIGSFFNKALRYSDEKKWIDRAGFVVFYLLLAILCVGIGSTLGADDFLVAFGAGYGFARDGWFAEQTESTALPNIIDLLLNNAMFIYFGTIIPWDQYSGSTVVLSSLTPGRLVAFLILVLLFRRIPVMLAVYRWTPDIKTFREALFCGHFGPMGLGALFLAIEARAVLENGSSKPDHHPPEISPPYTSRQRATEIVWPLISFVVFGSTMVHGLSVLALSIIAHFRRNKEDRAHFLGAETDPLDGMVHEEGDGDSQPDEEQPLLS